MKSLAFKRFLEISKALHIKTDVVTDNDGKVEALRKKYQDYDGDPNISIRYDPDEDYKTLEPQMLKANGRELLNKILGTEYKTDEELIEFMTRPDNKTDVALKIFETSEDIKFPEYIANAVQ